MLWGSCSAQGFPLQTTFTAENAECAENGMQVGSSLFTFVARRQLKWLCDVLGVLGCVRISLTSLVS